MFYIIYPSDAIELEDHERKRFVLDVKRVKRYNLKGLGVAKVEFIYFKDATR